MDLLGPCLRLRAGRVLHDNRCVRPLLRSFSELTADGAALRFVNQALLRSMTVGAVFLIYFVRGSPFGR
jgi:hypothetical protein